MSTHHVLHRAGGQWCFNKDQNCWVGNPTRAAEVEDLMKTIHHKNGAEGGEQMHSLTMSKLVMDKLYTWSIYECPSAKFGLLLKDLENLKSTAGHLHFCAFSSTGWTVWSR